jgi:hypothetical protein
VIERQAEQCSNVTSRGDARTCFTAPILKLKFIVNVFIFNSL